VSCLTLVVTEEAGSAFRSGLEKRLSERGLEVRIGSIGDPTADAAVVGGLGAGEEVRSCLRAGARWIQALTTGVEDVLVPELMSSDVTLTNSAGATAGPVAEFAFARILEHAKRLEDIRRYQGQRSWTRFFQASLDRATLTTLGLGPIGRRVVEIARSFGMHTIAVRRRLDAGPGPCDEVFGTADLGAALGRSDYVVLAAAVTPETRGVVGAAELDAAKEGCLIVNIGRAELVDYDALLERVRAGKLSASLDVFPSEPLSSDSPWWSTPGVTVSAHIAVWTPQIVETLADLVAANVERFVQGRPMTNVVDKSLGYVLT
jgi:phosphoglycerate dehydrogenase-like enzyme